jgi:hypothetical protein
VSHVPVLVLHCPDQSVDDLLAPFDLSMKVHTRRQRCHCVENNSRAPVWAQAEADTGTTIAEISKRFTEAHAQERDLLWNRRTWDPVLAKKLYDEWTGLVEPWRRAYQLASTRELADAKPDPDCEFCGGTGEYETERNPEGKWDWYQIGGRCSGALDGYDPEQDPANQERCHRCGGSGRSLDHDAPGACRRCAGQGRVAKWPTQWKPHPGDTVPVARVPPDYVPTAVVTPDYRWHEIEEAGWLGLPLDDQWIAEVRRLVDRHADCMATIVDIHR